MDITVESVTQLLGQKELEIHLLRGKVAELEVQLAAAGANHNTPQRPNEK